MKLFFKWGRIYPEPPEAHRHKPFGLLQINLINPNSHMPCGKQQIVFFFDKCLEGLPKGMAPLKQRGCRASTPWVEAGSQVPPLGKESKVRAEQGAPMPQQVWGKPGSEAMVGSISPQARQAEGFAGLGRALASQLRENRAGKAFRRLVRTPRGRRWAAPGEQAPTGSRLLPQHSGQLGKLSKEHQSLSEPQASLKISHLRETIACQGVSGKERAPGGEAQALLQRKAALRKPDPPTLPCNFPVL